MASNPTFRVVVAGGGIAGVEALLTLRDLAGDRVETTLLSPADEFVYRPFAVAEPFGLGHAERIPLERVAKDTGARWVRGTLAEVDDAAGTVRTEEGEEIAFDALLVAVGAVAVEGVEGATTWRPAGDPEQFGGLLRDLEEGYAKSVAFVVPSGWAWPLPVYELALMAARELSAMGQSEVSLSVVTPEAEPLALFGEAASAAVRDELGRAGIRLVTSTPARVRRTDGGSEIVAPDGTTAVSAGRVVAVPRLLGPALAGLPADEEGFLLTGDDGRAQGLERTWAAGDGVASPVKLGGLATWQAARAATEIARLAGADVPPLGDDEVVLEGVLMTGAAPRRLDGSPQEARAGAPIWRPAGKVAGRRLPGYLGDDGPTAPDDVHADAVRVELKAADVRTLDPQSLFDLSEPVHPNAPELKRLGSMMHDVRRHT